MPSGQLRDLGQRVEVARVHLAGVGDHDLRAAVPGELALQRVEVEAPDVIPCETADVAAAQPEHPDRLNRARVHVAARDDDRARQAGNAITLDVDAETLGPPVAGGGERDDVGHRRTARQHAPELLRQFEELAQPVDRDLLQAGSERRRRPCVSDLVVRRGQPVGGERRRRPAAHDEVKEARTARARGSRARTAGQFAQRLKRAFPRLGHRVAPALDRRLAAGTQHMLVGQRLEVAPRLTGGELERRVEVRTVKQRVRHGDILGAARLPPQGPPAPSDGTVGPGTGSDGCSSVTLQRSSRFV
jgi:hypothetical protein